MPLVGAVRQPPLLGLRPGLSGAQDGDPEAVASFFAALQGAAREEPVSGCDEKN